MVIIDRPSKSILIPRNDRVVALFPQAPSLAVNGTTYTVLPHNPRTHITLRAAELEIPAPILWHYDFPSADGKKAFQIQKNTAALVTSNQRSYVFNDLGCGKTKAAIWGWDYLRKSGLSKRLLIVAPLSTLRFVWHREITMTIPQYKVAVLHGTKKQRLDLLNSDADIFVINHDGLRVVANEIHEREDIDCLILDELAVYRNRSQRTLLMQKFSERFVWIYGMTGRPMPQSPVDVFYQAKIITPWRVPRYWRHAQSQLMLQVDQFKWVARDNAIETALGWLQPSVRYSLDDVVELPEAVHRRVDVELTKAQAFVYRELANTFVAMVDNQEITAANAAVALGKLLQIGCGYVYTENPQYVVLDSEPRQQKLLEIIDEAPDKLIVCAPWRHLIDNLSTLLTEHDHAVVHGGISALERSKIFSDFQMTSRYRVLLVHPAVAHHGLTLTQATTVVWYSPITSLDVYEQLNARIRRIGQQKKQLFLHMQASPVDSKVYAMLRAKKKTQDEFLRILRTANEQTSGDDPDVKGDQG